MGGRDQVGACLRHRQVQLPLHVLHAGRGPGVARTRRDPHVRGDRAAGTSVRTARRRGGADERGGGRPWARLGVEEVRLTGGEPLVRRALPLLVEMLAAIDGVNDLSLTTNGVLLDRFAKPLVDAGLQRLNVSLDSLNHVRFAEITRRDALDAVLRGLEEAERYPQLRPIKINCVAVKGFTETEVPALAELARRKPYVVRFIEFMPLDADEAWREDDVLT